MSLETFVDFAIATDQLTIKEAMRLQLLVVEGNKIFDESLPRRESASFDQVLALMKQSARSN